MTSSKTIRSITSHKFVTYRIRSCVVSWDCRSSFWDQRNMSMHPAERSPGAGGSTVLHVLGLLAIPQGFEWTDIQWLLWSDLFDKHTRYERYNSNHVWQRLCQIVYCTFIYFPYAACRIFHLRTSTTLEHVDPCLGWSNTFAVFVVAIARWDGHCAMSWSWKSHTWPELMSKTCHKNHLNHRYCHIPDCHEWSGHHSDHPHFASPNHKLTRNRTTHYPPRTANS